ncbi:MAG: peptidase M50 [Firmicutes bacterium]|nr:peptidase M50 [Bacillota bacterium]
MPLGSIGGVKLRLSLLWVVFIALWGLAGFLPRVALVCGFLAVHELAHGLAARLLGVKVAEVELYPFGGVARIAEQLELEPYVERRIALAGPAANLLLAALAVMFHNRGLGPRDWLQFMIESNLVLALFNLLPALPLDGGRVLRSYLAPLVGYRAASRQAARVGQFLAVALLLVGLATGYGGHFNWSLMVAALFLFVAASRERSQAVYQFIRSLVGKESELLKKGCLRGEQLVVLEETRLLEIFRLFSPQRYHFILVLDRSQRLRGKISESTLVKAALREGLNIPVKRVL